EQGDSTAEAALPPTMSQTTSSAEAFTEPNTNPTRSSCAGGIGQPYDDAGKLLAEEADHAKAGGGDFFGETRAAAGLAVPGGSCPKSPVQPALNLLDDLLGLETREVSREEGSG
ncbi:unnamed protein product, partial [Laminaria digitata]